MHQKDNSPDPPQTLGILTKYHFFGHVWQLVVTCVAPFIREGVKVKTSETNLKPTNCRPPEPNL